MINLLFRTQFESNNSTFIVFLALNGLMSFLLIQIHFESSHEPEPSNAFHFIVFWLLIFCAVAATMALIRQNREKHGRLYAQLPVSPREVRLAYWGLAGLYILISTGVLTLIMLFSVVPPGAVPVFSLLYFFHAGALLAVLSIFTSNNLPLIPEEIRRNSIVYFFMAALLTFLTLFGMGLLATAYSHVMNTDDLNWTMLAVLMGFVCAGLVTLDVYLFERKEDYLG